MTLEQLRIFLAVAEREHVTRAAEALHLTQSATSSAIAALEARHGVRLFDRVGRRIVLTEAGRAFLPEARAVLARAEAAERALADVAGLARGTLRLAASQTLGTWWLPAVMVAFHRAHPGVALDLRLANTAEVARAVAAMEADLGFVEGPVASNLLRLRDLGGDRLSAVVTPDHPWARVAPTDLAQACWLLREPGSGTRAICERLLARQGLTPEDLPDRIAFASNEAVLAAALAGGGVAVLSRLVTAEALAAGRLVEVPGLPAIDRPFTALCHRERPPSRAEAAFLDLALSRVKAVPVDSDPPAR
ncbi:LysR family transcriptional regulator [Frigidibacter sp. MR17.14]|uniref:LysR family transcriptional regulator n=1 Tax=Frigidibacter sp. MR17.14 TaxID=3126509 RepID=UPI003012DB18